MYCTHGLTEKWCNLQEIMHMFGDQSWLPAFSRQIRTLESAQVYLLMDALR